MNHKCDICELCHDWPKDLKNPGLVAVPVTAIMEDSTTLLIRCFWGECQRELARIKVRQPPSITSGCQGQHGSKPCKNGFPLFLHGRCHIHAPAIIEVLPDLKLRLACSMPTCQKDIIVIEPVRTRGVK